MGATTLVGPGYDPVSFERVDGVEVAGVQVGDTEAAVTFRNGQQLRMWLTGDCCSQSYFTEDARESFQDLVGTSIAGAEDRQGDHTEDDGTSVAWHFLVFVTNGGHVTVDWRNDSNGYYDGNVYGEWL